MFIVALANAKATWQSPKRSGRRQSDLAFLAGIFESGSRPTMLVLYCIRYWNLPRVQRPSLGTSSKSQLGLGSRMCILFGM